MRAALIAFVAAAALACAIAPSVAQNNNVPVTIDNFVFGPGRLTVKAGTTVTWTNRDEDSHTVTSTEGIFASPALDRGETFSYRFTAPGTYAYYCALHPRMTARILVE